MFSGPRFAGEKQKNHHSVEVTPVSAKQSSENPPENAIDGDWSTKSLASSENGHQPWLKVLSSQVYCIHNVTMYYSKRNYHYFTYFDDEWMCQGQDCDALTLTVSTEHNTTPSNLTCTSNCGLGDTILLKTTFSELWMVELLINGQRGFIQAHKICTMIKIF